MKNHISKSLGQRIIRALIFIIVCMALPVHAWAEEDKGYPLASWNKKTGELFLFYYPPGTLFVKPQGGDYVWYDVRDEYSSIDKPEWSGDHLKTVVIDPSFADYRPTSTAFWFFNCSSLTSIEGLENINTSEVTNMRRMFDGCSSLKELDLGGWDTRNVENMHGLFDDCSALTMINISDFNTGSVKDMSSMFWACSSLETIDVSCFDTHNVTDMSNMFGWCSSLKSIDVSGFKTDNVRDMSFLFEQCKSIEELNLGSFNTSNVTDFSGMFTICHSLTKILVSREGWNTEKMIGNYNVFFQCYNLVGGQGTCYDPQWTYGGYAHIDGGPSNPGYLTEDTNGQFEDNSGQTRAYCVLNNGVLTFYYDNKVNSRQGLKFPVERNDGALTMPQWYYKRSGVKKAVFDPSFAAFRPTCTARWFYSFPNLVSIEGLNNLNTSQVTTMAEMFRFSYSLLSLDVSSFDTSQVTDMGCMFCLCTSLAHIDVSNFDTSKVKSMLHMFHACPLTTLDLRSFDTSNVTDMYWMFIDSSVKTIYASEKWSTASVKSSREMFKGCQNLVGGMGTKYDSKHIDHEYAQIDGGLCDPGYLTGEYQNGEPEPYAVLDNKGTLTLYYDWNRGCREGISFDIPRYHNEGRDGSYPKWFHYKEKIIHIDFDSSFAGYHPIYTFEWFAYLEKLEKVTNIQYLNTDQVINARKMFYYCINLKSLDVSHFDTSNVEDMSEVFSGCHSLTALDVSGFNTSKVKYMSELYRGCSEITFLDVSHFDTSNVIRMDGLFSGCGKLQSLDVSNFNTSKVETMNGMFAGCYTLPLIDVSHFDTSTVTDMCGMFSLCSSLPSIDVSHFDTSNVKDMSGMFAMCTSLPSLDVSNFNTKNVQDMGRMFLGCLFTELDLSNFNTANVTDMYMMFRNCENLKDLKISNFNTSKVTVMHYMFENCTSLPEIHVENFNTSNVTNMYTMFNGCKSVTTLDLSSFKTNMVEEFYGMFHSCENLVTIYVSDLWNMSRLKTDTQMFYHCYQLEGGQGTRFADIPTDNVWSFYAHIDGGPSNPGYFTYKEYDETKGVEDVRVTGRMENEAMYNLQGIRLKEPVKGLYIKNGKKYLKR